MTLNKDFFKKETNIKAKVICDSITTEGVRLTTLEVEYPRFIHSEVMTHRMLSKNCSSSRAIPVKTMLESIERNMAVPLYFGASKSGMQATEEIQFPELAKKFWKACGNACIKDSLTMFEDFKLHKQLSNRITEPYQMIKVLITGTEWDNFFNLRLHKDSQPEICMLAYQILWAMLGSHPIEIKSGEWHLPYIDRIFDLNGNMRYYISDTGVELSLDTAKKVSASCSAQTSYRKNDTSIEKAVKVFDMLVHADVLHASPFEHLATPIQSPQRNHLFYFLNQVEYPESWEDGITHTSRDGSLWSGNLRGYVSYRHKELSAKGNCTEFNFIERMKEFE